MKTLMRVLLGLVVIGIVGVAALMGLGSVRLAAAVEVEAHGPPEPATDSASIAEGRRLADALACTECHGAGLEGTDFMDAGPFMRLPAPSLAGRGLTPDQYERAIRHGIGPAGRVLIIMPSDAYAGMSDEDLASLTGFLESLPPVDATTLTRSVGPIGRAVAAFQASQLQPARRIDQASDHPARPEGSVSRFGALCSMCHGADFGGQVFSAEVAYWAPNLTSHPTGAGSWALEEFSNAIRTGRTPDGRQLDPAQMPWRGFSKLTDAEVEDLWLFLRSRDPVDRARPAEFAIAPS